MRRRAGRRAACYHARMDLTPELIAIVTVGVALFAFLWRLSRDVARLERELRQEVRGLERDMQDMGARFEREMQDMGSRSERDMQSMGGRLRQEMQDMGGRLQQEIHGLGERVARLEGAVEANSALLRALLADRRPEAAD